MHITFFAPRGQAKRELGKSFFFQSGQFFPRPKQFYSLQIKCVVIQIQGYVWCGRKWQIFKLPLLARFDIVTKSFVSSHLNDMKEVSPIIPLRPRASPAATRSPTHVRQHTVSTVTFRIRSTHVRPPPFMNTGPSASSVHVRT